MPLSKRAAAEFFGTFWLVFGGCGSAVLPAGLHLRIRYLRVSFPFRLTVLTLSLPLRPLSPLPFLAPLCLTLIHLISSPVTSTSVNPARSTGPAIFVGGWALSQLWLFWVAPILGAIIGGLISTTFFAAPQQPISEEMAAKP